MAGPYDKLYYNNIKLINSVVKDGDGNQISLTSDERLGVVNAIGGPTTALNPLVTELGMQDYVDVELGNYNAGVAWKAPAEFIGSVVTAPVTETAPLTPNEGDTYVDPTTALLYTYTGGSWDAGVLLADGSYVVDETTGDVHSIASSTLDAGTTPTDGYSYINTEDNKVYAYTDSWDTGTDPGANWVIATKDTDKTYMYDLETTTWNEQPNMNSIPVASETVFGKVKIGTNVTVNSGTISIADATTEVKGVVELATDGEVAASLAVQSNDSRLLKGRYHNTYADVTNFEVVHNLSSTKLMVQVWSGDEVIEAYVVKKSGSESTTLQIGLNSQATVEVSVIAIP